MSINISDLTNQMNALNTANMSTLFGPGRSGLGGLSGDLIQQWGMRHANSAAYRKLLEAQETGTVKKDTTKNIELLSEKYFPVNDTYTKSDGTKAPMPTYQPGGTTEIPKNADALAQLESMRRLALAAVSNPDSINNSYANVFEQLRKAIGGALVTSGSSSSTTTVDSPAKAATLTKTVDFRLLTDDQMFTVAGNKGEKTYNFQTGASLQDMADAINADSASTGVKAELVVDDNGDPTSFKLVSASTGKEAFVRVDQTLGSFFASAGASSAAGGSDATTASGTETANGQDAKAAMAADVFTGKLFADQAFTLMGASGSAHFSFKAGTSVADMVDAINAQSAKTGITAQAIVNGNGEAEGIGLVTDTAGDNSFIQVEQSQGDLFAKAGKKAMVSGVTGGNEKANEVNSLKQLGRISWDGQTYSFADLALGGRASLDKNPDAALAIIDQAIQDIYSGRAKMSNVDLSNSSAKYYDNGDTAARASNVLNANDTGSAAVADWLKNYLLKS